MGHVSFLVESALWRFKQFAPQGLRSLSVLSYPTTLVLQKNDGRESCSSQHEYEVGGLANSPVSIPNVCPVLQQGCRLLLRSSHTSTGQKVWQLDPNMRWKY